MKKHGNIQKLKTHQNVTIKKKRKTEIESQNQ